MLVFTLLLAALSPAAFAQAPDAVYFHANVVTLEAARPKAEAFAIRGGEFQAIGSNDEMLKLAGPATRKVDLEGRTVIPGIVESHVHPIMAALAEKDGPVPVMRSIAEVKVQLKKMAGSRPVSEVLFLPKVYSTRLTDRRYPTRYELDEAAPNHVALTDNGYASVLNSKALAKLGITKDTPQPANGKIIKDAKGEPTGLILGAAQLLGGYRRSKPPTVDDLKWALREMQKKYHEVGITSIIDRGQTAEGFRTYQALRMAGELTVRSNVTFLISAQGTPDAVRAELERIPFVTGYGDDMLRVGSVKTIADGGILIGTAFLREPYGEHTEIYGYKDPDYRGVLSVSKENLAEMARTALRLGWQMTAHTTGGGAIDTLLEAYDAVDKETPIKGRRFTVTHGNFPSQESIERAARLGVAFDCQPQWYYFDTPALAPAFGPSRMKQFQPLKTMLGKGVVVAGGSDHMIRFDSRDSINPYNPFWGMWMTITRKTVDGSTINPDEALTREQALALWTKNGAYLTFEEKRKGTIAAGKLADFAVISDDLLTCPVDRIKDIEALRTVVGGREVWLRR
ncbi:MAG: amidohydrolase [Bryobacterales bacterium]|nr:amidohydrolase [Bryobacterales bacterium]